jgi:hypothetical protein
MSEYVHKVQSSDGKISSIFDAIPKASPDSYFVGPLSDDELSAIRARVPYSPEYFLTASSPGGQGPFNTLLWFQHEKPDTHFDLKEKLGPPETPRKAVTREIGGISYTIHPDGTFTSGSYTNIPYEKARAIAEFIMENQP